MPALSSYLNVYSSAVAVLHDQGYRVWTDQTDHWFAERDGWDFSADNPIELLGLAAIHGARAPEHFKEYWWQHPLAQDLDDVPTTPPTYTAVWAGKQTP